MTVELIASDLTRIAGFLGLDNGEFAKQLEVSPAYLSRVINVRDKLTSVIIDKALQLLEKHIKTLPEDQVASVIRDLSFKYMPKEKALSETWLRVIWSNYTKEDFTTLSQRRRSIVHDLKKAAQEKSR